MGVVQRVGPRGAHIARFRTGGGGAGCSCTFAVRWDACTLGLGVLRAFPVALSQGRPIQVGGVNGTTRERVLQAGNVRIGTHGQPVSLARWLKGVHVGALTFQGVLSPP